MRRRRRRHPPPQIRNPAATGCCYTTAFTLTSFYIYGAPRLYKTNPAFSGGLLSNLSIVVATRSSPSHRTTTLSPPRLRNPPAHDGHAGKARRHAARRLPPRVLGYRAPANAQVAPRQAVAGLEQQIQDAARLLRRPVRRRHAAQWPLLCLPQGASLSRLAVYTNICPVY